MLAILQYLKYLPLIMEIVQTIEKMVGDNLTGKEKRAAAVQMVNDSVAILAPGTIQPKEVEAVGSLIDVVVGVANAFGILGKKKK